MLYLCIVIRRETAIGAGILNTGCKEISMTSILKVVSLSEAQTIESQKAEGGQIRKRTAVMQQPGSKYENSFVVTLFGKEADRQLTVGDVVVAALRFLTHEYNGQTYQDVVAEEIINLADNKPF